MYNDIYYFYNDVFQFVVMERSKISLPLFLIEMLEKEYANLKIWILAKPEIKINTFVNAI